GDRILTGLVHAEGADKIRLIDTNARETILSRALVAEMHASTVSIMPKGYAELLGPGKLKDLVTYLTTQMPESEKDRPAPRKRREVDAVLGKPPATKNQKLRPLEIVLVASPQDHGPGE